MRLPALLALLTLTACSFDLTEIRFTEAAPQFSVTASATAGEPVLLVAGFHPGTTSNGGLRPVVEEDVAVDGVLHEPALRDSTGARQYNLLLPAPASPLVIRPPRAAGFDPGSVMVDIISIRSPAEILVTAGDVIEIAADGIPPDRTIERSWCAGIRGATGPPIFTICERGGTSQVLRIPTVNLSPDFTVGTIDVQIGLDRRRIEQGGYLISMSSSASASLPLSVIREQSH